MPSTMDIASGSVPRAQRDRDESDRHGQYRNLHHKRDRSRDRIPKDRGHKRKRVVSPPLPDRLPMGAKPLSKHDLSTMKPLLASYLDIQKQLFIEDLSEDEVRGRWKSFVNKWNRGQLAEGWYDPATKHKAVESFHENAMQSQSKPQSHTPKAPDDASSENDDDYGPVRPESASNRPRTSRPTAPTFSDLTLRAEQAADDAMNQREDLRHERKTDRQDQRERLDELAPRAEPGTRERQMEKKAEKAESARAFKDAKGGAGDIQEVPESDLMGGDSGGMEDVKRMKKEAERKRTEREQRKIEVLQARAVEREERLQVVREKETKTMEMLKAIAKERFG